MGISNSHNEVSHGKLHWGTLLAGDSGGATAEGQPCVIGGVRGPSTRGAMGNFSQSQNFFHQPSPAETSSTSSYCIAFIGNSLNKNDSLLPHGGIEDLC